MSCEEFITRLILVCAVYSVLRVALHVLAALWEASDEHRRKAAR